MSVERVLAQRRPARVSPRSCGLASQLAPLFPGTSHFVPVSAVPGLPRPPSSARRRPTPLHAPPRQSLTLLGRTYRHLDTLREADNSGFWMVSR